MALTNPQTFNDKQISELSRNVFMKAMTKAHDMLDEPSCSPDRLHAVAAVADAAAAGFEPEDEQPETY